MQNPCGIIDIPDSIYVKREHQRFMEERGGPDIFYLKETSYHADKLRIVDKKKLILFLKQGADPSSIVINRLDAK